MVWCQPARSPSWQDSGMERVLGIGGYFMRAAGLAGSSEVIHLGGQAAVVVPVTDFLRLRALEQAAAPHELEDAEDTAAMLEWKARDAAGQTTLVSADGARRRLGMPR